MFRVIIDKQIATINYKKTAELLDKKNELEEK